MLRKWEGLGEVKKDSKRILSKGNKKYKGKGAWNHIVCSETICSGSWKCKNLSVAYRRWDGKVSLLGCELLWIPWQHSSKGTITSQTEQDFSKSELLSAE
jgi:hypothetical protein